MKHYDALTAVDRARNALDSYPASLAKAIKESRAAMDQVATALRESGDEIRRLHNIIRLLLADAMDMQKTDVVKLADEIIKTAPDEDTLRGCEHYSGYVLYGDEPNTPEDYAEHRDNYRDVEAWQEKVRKKIEKMDGKFPL